MRCIARALLIVIAVLAGLVLAAVVGLRSSWGRAKLATVAEQQAERLLDADISIGAIEGNVFSSPTLRDLRVSRNGAPILSAERLAVRYDAQRLLGGEMAIDAVTLTKPVIHVTDGPDGIPLFDLITRQTTVPRGPPGTFDMVPIVIVDGRVVIGPDIADVEGVALPDELRDLQARVGIERTVDSLRIHVEQLSFVGRDPQIVLQRLSGDIVVAGGTLAFDEVEVETAESRFRLDGSIDDVKALAAEPGGAG